MIILSVEFTTILAIQRTVSHPQWSFTANIREDVPINDQFYFYPTAVTPDKAQFAVNYRVWEIQPPAQELSAPQNQS
jgi:regulation of enolase protein 1 (concanavalin A-like superfamily)